MVKSGRKIIYLLNKEKKMRMTNLARLLSVIMLIFCGSIVFAETFNNVYIGDVGWGYTWAGFGHKDIASTTGYALLQQNDGANTLINKRDTGNGFIGFRVENVDKMVILNNGNVGINQTNPSEKLEVGSGNIYTNGENYGLIIDSYGYKRTGFMKYGGIEGSLVHGNATPLRFGRVNQQSVAEGTYTEEMRIDPNGRVGIGTTSTDYALTVKAANSAFSIVGTDGTIRVGIATYYPDPQFSAGWFGTMSNHPLVIATNSSERMVIDLEGKVGIGTMTPDYALTVKKGTGNPTFVGTDGTIKVGISTYTNGNPSSNAGWFGTISNNPLVIASNNTIRMTLDTAGNLGIGATSPTAKLDVLNGAVMIRGTGAGLTITDSSTFGFGVSSPTSGQVRLKTDAAGRWLSFADGAGTADVLTIKSGVVCIGPTSPQAGSTLTVSGDGYFTGIVTTGSSRSLKHDIKPLSTLDALAALKKIEPMRFRYNANGEDEKLGFISEDVPGLVAEKDRKSLNPMDFIAVAIAVIKDQQTRIGDQQARIEKLEKEIKNLK
jgi:hypothetical protein